jgi:arylsulfatase A-like enzyme
MTGRYPTRFGHEFNSSHNNPGLAATETTLATRLKSAGYATACVGKWHLGGQPENRPTKRGFDEFYGTLANTPFFHPTNFVDSRVSSETVPVTDPKFYTTDAYAVRAVDWLERNQAGPWFLYLPFNAQHAPLQAPQKYLDRFAKIEDEKRRTFAAMLSAMDDAVGAVMQKVRDLKQEENTLVFYIADNGGPTPVTTSSNGPLNGFKSTTWEGGTRVPFVAQWKGTLPAGRVYEQPVLNLDVLPTVLTAAGVAIDPAWKLDGVDLLPHFVGENTPRPHQTLYWRFGEQWAVRHGDLKLVVARGGSGQPELYDLASDIGEQKNLAATRPEDVKELQALYDAWDAEQAEPNAPNTANRPRRNRPNRNQPKPANPAAQPGT